MIGRRNQRDNTMQEHQNHQDEAQAHRKHTSFLKLLGAGTLLATGAVILSPYVLPALGIGGADMAAQSLAALHGTGLGDGLAGFVSKGLNAIPLVGTELAKGGYAAALSSAAVGIGGVLLGQFLEQKQDGSKGINWGRVITVGALATSVLIALPSVLTSISVGVTFLAGAIGGTTLASSAATLMANTFGSMGVLESIGGDIATGIAAMLPHLIACGASLLPAFVSYGKDKQTEKEQARQLTHSDTVRRTTTPNELSQKYSDGSIQASITAFAPTAANAPCRATITLLDKATGKPLTPDDLAEVHTQKIHLFVTDSSLKDYQHIHPEPLDTLGKYVFSFTPSTNNPYTVWADITKNVDGQNHKLKLPLPAAMNRKIAPTIRTNQQAEADGLTLEWRSPTPLKAGLPATIEVAVRDASGKPVTDLEPVMGAYAHLVGFSADGNSLIHAHPMGKEPVHDTERGGPNLAFHLTPDDAGKTQFYLQIKRGGKDIYAPFGQEIARQSPEKSENFSFRAHQSHQVAQPSL